MLDNNHPLWQKIWSAPAKINEFLHIVGRREDGYHLLQTVFRLINLFDYLQFSPANKICLSNCLAGVAEQHDLCYRAAKLLQEYSQTDYGVEITLSKNIPLGAGLGGGSSDAATVLLALNQLWQLNYDLGELSKLALTLGADVPVFVGQKHAFAEGVGEILTPIQLPASYLIILKPNIAVATAGIFTHPQLKRDMPIIKLKDWLDGIAGKSPRITTVNNLTAITTLLYPEVAHALELLNKFAPAQMSGSGASVFAHFASLDDAQKTLEQLKILIANQQFSCWLVQSMPVDLAEAQI